MKTITICGSMKFKNEMMQTAERTLMSYEKYFSHIKDGRIAPQVSGGAGEGLQ